MYSESTRSMGTGWKARQKRNEERKQELNDPAMLERRKAVHARQEAERALQMRLAAEQEARRQSEFVQFPPMSVKQAAEIVAAFERYRSAGREATPAEVEAFSHMVQGLPANPGSPLVHVTHGLPMPVPSSGFVAPAVEPMVHQEPSVPLANVLKSARAKKPASSPELESGVFLIEDDDD